MTHLSEIYVIALIVVIVKCQEEVVLNTTLGEMKGIRRIVPPDNITVFEFFKIPYAKAPVGNLRFEKPNPFGSWNGVLDATTFGPSCYQTLGPEKQFLQNQDISEDCLHLNIYVPNNVSIGEHKSVMVWIHGGGYSSGQAALYDGTNLAISGDVIVVTINYRLNVFGFFATDLVKGNYGLWDQIMAIKWVKNNIESFGGNSKSITIFGESAGGFSVGLLSIIPSNRGLFQRAILQSGTAVSIYAVGSTTRQSSKELANSINCTQTEKDLFVQCLKHLDAIDLFQTYSSLRLPSSLFSIPFAPVVDGELITDDPQNVLKNENSEGYSFYRSLDVVIGTVSGEGSLFLAILSSGFEERFNFNVTDHIPKSILCAILGPDIASINFNNNKRISGSLCDKYGKADNLVAQSLNILDAYSDFFFYIPSVKSLRTHSSKNMDGKSYQYIFSRPPGLGLLGTLPAWFTRAGHTSDAIFLFTPFYASASDYMLAAYFRSYWTHFAKTGNMNAPGLPQWNEYDIGKEYYINFDVPISTGHNLHKDRVDFWLKDIPAMLQTSAGSSINYLQISKLSASFMYVMLIVGFQCRKYLCQC